MAGKDRVVAGSVKKTQEAADRVIAGTVKAAAQARQTEPDSGGQPGPARWAS